MKPKVDFFIVGAPKCGTTALMTYLGMHPEIFMPDMIVGNSGKIELNHFAEEFHRTNHQFANRDLYHSLFDGAPPKNIIGEASVYHLYSEKAPERIYEYNPAAKIIIMIRSPADFILSYFHEMRFNHLEACETLSQALEVEDARLSGSAPLPGQDVPELYLGYRHLARFSGYIQHYLRVFPPGQVFIIPFHEFTNETALVYSKTLDFLGVKAWEPESFPPVNPAKEIRFRLLRTLLTGEVAWGRSWIRKCIPDKQRHILWHSLFRLERKWNTRLKKVDDNAELRMKLKAEYTAEVEKLETITGLNLSAWK